LPRLRRLVATLQRLQRTGVEAPLYIERWPRRAWSSSSDDATAPSLAEEVGAAWNQSEAWLVAHPAGHQLFWLRQDELWDAALDADTARVGAAAADGAPVPPDAPELRQLALLLASG
jgi:hypothetical protein